MPSNDELLRRKLLLAAFQLPSVQTMVSRTSSITNAFVNSIIPSFQPSPEEIEEVLAIFEMEPTDVRCAYCGDKSSEWDHLRPLVLNKRPTGYISEIANLVPACGKCNQSKGNKDWRAWMRSAARLSPTGRQLQQIEQRIERLARFELWRTPTVIDFATMLGPEEWQRYWALYDELLGELRKCQDFADGLRAKVGASVRR